MAEAKIDSIDALKSLKTVLIKFAEYANVALGDAEGDVTGTIHWLENEQITHWQSLVRKHTLAVGRCKESVRMKKLFRDSSGRQQSAIEEEKALKIALRQLEEAEMKLAATRKAIKRIEKEFPLYKATVQRFATAVTVELPAAASHLENLIRSLEAYTSLSTPTEITSTAPVGAGAPTESKAAEYQSMTRTTDEDQPEPGEPHRQADSETRHPTPDTRNPKPD